MRDKKGTLIKFIGIATTVIGIGVNLVTDWVNEKTMDEKIEEKREDGTTLRAAWLIIMILSVCMSTRLME